MMTISRSALLPYKASQVFDLVNDIEAYPAFMDGCVGAKVLVREPQFLEARLDLAKGGITQSFTTRNTMVGSNRITLELVEGPFEYFSGSWGFQALSDSACKVSLHIDFAMNNTVLGIAAGKLFNRVTNNLVDAVSKRAKVLYG